MFDEAWRLERDFYYDPAMGGLDWKAVGDRYRQLVPYVAHRADLNYILGELIGELATSHTYVSGGDVPQAAKVDVGLLGADYALDAASGLYRFKTHLPRPRLELRDRGTAGRARHRRAGGRPAAGGERPPGARPPRTLYAAFVEHHRQADHASRSAARRTMRRPRTYTVVPIASEASLRYTAWVAANREKVAKATGGQIAYIHVPNTATAGIQEFTKQYYPQVDKQGHHRRRTASTAAASSPTSSSSACGARPGSHWSEPRRRAASARPRPAIDGPEVHPRERVRRLGRRCLPVLLPPCRAWDR